MVTRKTLKILVIGGTRFVGKHLVEEALKRNHRVTLFNRGKNNLFPMLENIIGDRNVPEDLAQLAKGDWDTVIDTCGYFPRQIENLTNLLSPKTHYTFISSVSVYKNMELPMQDENAELIKIERDSPEVITGETYGGFKALCEESACKAMPNTLIFRPGLIAGPCDPTDRFTYWPYRLSKGGKVLAPGKPDLPIQFIDARDLAAWAIEMAEKRETGIFNVINSPNEINFGNLLETCKLSCGSKAEILWVDEDFLISSEIQPWIELPLWVPGEAGNFMLTSDIKAKAAGLKTRPLLETVQDVLKWRESLPENYEPQAGLAPEKEQATLEKWLAQGSSGE